MQISMFVEQVASLFEDTDPSLIKEDTVFRDLEEWDSLIALSLIAMADEEYGIKLTGDDIRTSNTVQDLFSKIQLKKN